MIKVTNDENIFYCSSVLGRARTEADSVKAWLDSVSPADAKQFMLAEVLLTVKKYYFVRLVVAKKYSAFW